MAYHAYAGKSTADPPFNDNSYGHSQQAREPFTAHGQHPMDTIDFSVSQSYFGNLEGARSPQHPSLPSHAHSFSAHHQPSNSIPMSPISALSGLDPVSQLGFNSNRSFASHQFNANGWTHPEARYDPHSYNGHVAYPHFSGNPAISPNASYTPQSYGTAPWPEPQAGTSGLRQLNHDSAHRVAEIERRNKLREEEKTRRHQAIQKQVDDGIAAVKLEKDQAAHRLAEVDRRNKLREEEKEKRKRAIQRQVEDGIKAIKLGKQRERARVETDRQACRKWLSQLHPTRPSASSSASTELVDVYAAIGRQLREFWQASRPADSSQLQRDEVIADVQYAIDRKWPGQGLKVAAFGSSVTGLITADSDLDLVLLDPTRPFGVGTPPELCCSPNGFVRHTGGMPEWYSTNQVANAVRNSNRFRTVVAISSASVPIIKMVHRKHNIPADININERFGLFNSQLISAYAELQPDLVRPLIFFLKNWFSRRDLNDPSGKRGNMTFSSYTIALMALQVLQVEGVLPNLQSPSLLKISNIPSNFLFARSKRPRRGKANRADGAGTETAGEGAKARQGASEEAPQPQKYNVTFATTQVDLEPYRRKSLELAYDGDPTISAEAETSVADRLLGRMLAAFVRFYHQWDCGAQIVSVAEGLPIKRRQASQPRHVLFDSASDEEATEGAESDQADVWGRDVLVVQDPFIIDRNTSRNIKIDAIERWRGEMERAMDLLRLNKPAGSSLKVRFDEAPLILDLCISPNVLSDMEKTSDNMRTSATEDVDTALKEPWRLEEEAAAKERETALEAAKMLRKEKKKQAKWAKARNTRILQEEAAMVEDMIDGLETGRVTGFMSGNERHEIWRLRADTDNNGSTLQSTPIPFTFSVARTPDESATSSSTFEKASTNDEGRTERTTEDAATSPAVSVATSKTDASSSSEDVDLVALRLEREARIAPA